MSEPVSVDLRLLPPPKPKPAPAEAPRMQLALLPDVGVEEAAGETPPGDDSKPAEAKRVRHEEAPVEAATTAQAADAPIEVAALPLIGYGVAWAFAVIMMAQAIKRTTKALGLKDWLGLRKWRRWLYVWPILSGCVLSVFVGQWVLTRAGIVLDLTPAAALFFMGPISGTAATWVYDFSRGVVLPLLPDTAIGLIERITGVTLPDDAKERAKERAERALNAGSTGFVGLEALDSSRLAAIDSEAVVVRDEDTPTEELDP